MPIALRTRYRRIVAACAFVGAGGCAYFGFTLIFTIGFRSGSLGGNLLAGTLGFLLLLISPIALIFGLLAWRGPNG